MSEAAAGELVADDVDAAVVLLSPSVHGCDDKGFIARLRGSRRRQAFPPMWVTARALGRRSTGMPARSIEADAARANYGWLKPFAAMDMPASAERTEASLGWTLTGPTLLTDITATLHVEQGDRA